MQATARWIHTERDWRHVPEGEVAMVERLVGLPKLEAIPRSELEWLSSQGRLESFEPGYVLAPKGERVDDLWLLLSGRMSAQVDRGTGPRLVMGWQAGDVSGLLPYSRMVGPPGDNVVEEAAEILLIHRSRFPEMIHRCPVFTAHTVHLMLDRARNFNTSDLQDEKMLSLGKLSAGLAHELNNPASAIVRGAKQLLASLNEAEVASRALGAAGLDHDGLQAIDRMRTTCTVKPTGGVLSRMQIADLEDEIADWLERHRCDPSHAARLAEAEVGTEALDYLAASVPPEALDVALCWISASTTAVSLAEDVVQAGNRISELVGAVKRFTYMDKLAGRELVDVEAGLRDTIRVLAAKAKSQDTEIVLDLAADLPPVHSSGGELNQVWMNLLDNALDAVSESGRIQVRGAVERDRVVVQVIDDGHGIPSEVLPKIFDPFFTTKPPGQGTGLGLDTTRRIVRRYDGDISAASQPGRTEFRVTLLAGASP